ncbi:hypothetical protein BDN72DRAFT_906901 [Pluteus cervinus]|uniref:Uncharacterized protein n=1 Tax=Pluteus cervinus TaxID=181527 RepID=A0ACD2ZYA7_9AGAR|nr:hypothetical protein BDN72DRAFT_906901 [Pluteus cervinus]
MFTCFKAPQSPVAGRRIYEMTVATGHVGYIKRAGHSHCAIYQTVWWSALSAQLRAKEFPAISGCDRFKKHKSIEVDVGLTDWECGARQLDWAGHSTMFFGSYHIPNIKGDESGCLNTVLGFIKKTDGSEKTYQILKPSFLAVKSYHPQFHSSPPFSQDAIMLVDAVGSPPLANGSSVVVLGEMIID